MPRTSPTPLLNRSENGFSSIHSSESILGPNFDNFWSQNGSQMHSEFISLSSLCSQLIFASKTKERRISKETKTLQNRRTVVQKSTLRIAELIVKSHLYFGRILYQNLPFFKQISSPKVYRKQTSSCDAVLASKVSPNGAQKASKMLCRN